MLECASMLDALEKELRATLNATVKTFVATARTRLESAVAEVAKERAKGLAIVAKERADLGREREALQKHAEAQEGRVELNIGGCRFQTSVQTLRRIPQTFFDAYFSGRYVQDVCEDGSIFVDRDGEHFGHVLQYMRDGVVSVAEPGARPGVSLLRVLKREFGFYCIEPVAEPERLETAYVIGGTSRVSGMMSRMEQYDASGQWSAAAAMGTARGNFGASVIAGEIYVSGGQQVEDEENALSTVEKYTPSNGTWSVVAPMPEIRSDHTAVAMGSAMYVMGGRNDFDVGVLGTTSVLKFDSTQGTWSSVAPMPEPRLSIAACAIDSTIYAFGGYHGWDSCDSVFRYDTETNVWSTLAPMPCVGSGISANVLDGLVYIVGAGGSASLPPTGRAIGEEVLRFDPVRGAWSSLARIGGRRDECASFVLGGCLYVAGGIGGYSDGQNGVSVIRYDVASDTWTPVADMLVGRQGSSSGVTVVRYGEEKDLFDTLVAKESSL
jgi:N-acetylneuraminic acid mutarotase